MQDCTYLFIILVVLIRSTFALKYLAYADRAYDERSPAPVEYRSFTLH
jgi:hypothetical protein